MKIDLTANGVRVNNTIMTPAPTRDAIAEQLKYMLFGTVPQSKES